ncbi:MAG: hypothetical protein ACI4NG_05535 [Candidatus Gallimonas sp.]
MNKKKKIILSVMFVLAALFAVAGCAVGEKSLDKLLEEGSYSCRVTYYSQEGTFDGSQSKRVRELYYRADAPVLNVGGDESITQVTVGLDGYIFDGWYFVETTTDGNGVETPVFVDEERSIVKSTDRKAEFPLRIQENEHWYLCAHWREDVRLEYVLVSEASVRDKEGKEYRNGDVIKSEMFGKSSSIQPTTPLESSDSTFLAFYTDEACTVPLSGAVARPNDETNPVIYAKYIPGLWTVVKTASDVKSMFFGLNAQNRYYVFADIDCNGQAFACPAGIRSVVQGNGKTISNFKMKREGISGDDAYGAFGKIGATAEVKDLTFSGVTIDYTVKTGSPSLYAICSDAETGASFENFRFETVSLNISCPSDTTIMNIQKIGGSYNTDHWLFGGAASDAAFAERFGGISVSDARLTIGGESVDGES